MLDKNDFTKHDFSSDEEAIDKALVYLQHVDPEHATREDAISYLQFMQTVGEQVAKVSSLDFDEFYEQYKTQQKSES